MLSGFIVSPLLSSPRVIIAGLCQSSPPLSPLLSPGPDLRCLHGQPSPLSPVRTIATINKILTMDTLTSQNTGHHHNQVLSSVRKSLRGSGSREIWDKRCLAFTSLSWPSAELWDDLASCVEQFIGRSIKDNKPRVLSLAFLPWLNNQMRRIGPVFFWNPKIVFVLQRPQDEKKSEVWNTQSNSSIWKDPLNCFGFYMRSVSQTHWHWGLFEQKTFWVFQKFLSWWS